MSATWRFSPRAGITFCLSVLLLGCGGGGSFGGGFGGSNAGSGPWVEISKQPPNISDATFVMIDNQGKLYSSGENGSGMYISADHGATWSPLNSGFVNACHSAMLLNGLGEPLASDGTNSSTPACASLPNHLYRLPNGSGTWTQASPGFTGFGQMPFQLLGTGSGAPVIAGGLAGSVWISADNGNSYQQCAGCASEFSTTGTAETLDIKSSLGGYLYVGTALGGVYYSTDNGNHWAQMPCNGGRDCAGGTGVAQDNKAIGMTPSGALLVSRDYDQGSVACYGPQPPPNGTWTRCDNGLAPGTGGHPNAVISGPGGFWLNPSHTVVFLAANSGASHIGGVYSSTDGSRWTKADSGLPPHPDAINFAADPTTGLLYVLVKGSGIYHTTTAP
jgi:photosystem II stability/assembly factor-like uncharacterized protein